MPSVSATFLVHLSVGTNHTAHVGRVDGIEPDGSTMPCSTESLHGVDGTVYQGRRSNKGEQWAARRLCIVRATVQGHGRTSRRNALFYWVHHAKHTR